MSTKNPRRLTAEIMQAAIRDLGELLRERGDLNARLIEKCADAIGLSYRKASRYWYGESPRPDRVHFKAIQGLLAGQKAPQDELRELREQLNRIERLLVQERSASTGIAPDEDWSTLRKFGRIHSPVA